jgi:multidrug efflux system outer membrane protein
MAHLRRLWSRANGPAKFVICILFLLLAGCAIGPNYHRPNVHAPPAFRGDAVALTNSMGDMPWWQLFQDPTLQALIATALTNNYDARLAVARVEEARAILAQNRSYLYPQVGYEGSVAAGTNAVSGTPFYGGDGQYVYGAGTVSWEIDLWGRLRRLTEASQAEFFASQEARHNVTISLVANVAQTYFQLLALDEELLIAQESTNSFGESLKIFSERLRGGVSSKLETASASAALASASATIPELRRQIVIQENQLRVLLGENPGPILRQRAALLTELLPDVPPGLPSALLRRRPDIRQAEDLLRAANAAIGLAQADFYPNINLTGLLGAVTPQLNLFASGTVTAWNVAATLTGPIFQGGRLKGQLHQARAQWSEALFQYRAAILTAFQEVSDSITSRDQLQLERIEQERAVAAYEEAVQVARQRYTAGQANYYELLQEQQQLFPAETALTQTRLNRLLAIVQLYLALGGGWQVPAH